MQISSLLFFILSLLSPLFQIRSQSGIHKLFHKCPSSLYIADNPYFLLFLILPWTRLYFRSLQKGLSNDKTAKNFLLLFSKITTCCYLYSRGAWKARGSTGYHSICFQDGHKKWFYGVMEGRKWYRFSPSPFSGNGKNQYQLKNSREIQDLTSITAEMTGDLGEALIHSQSLLS